MANSYGKLDQALKDLIEAFTEIEAELDSKFSDDEDAYASSLLEALETSVESAIDDQDTSTSAFAGMLSSLTEALELLDPSAFQDEGEEEEDEESDYEIEDVDYEDLDEDEDPDEEDE